MSVNKSPAELSSEEIKTRTVKLLRSLTEDVLTMGVNLGQTSIVREMLLQEHDLNFVNSGKLLWTAVRNGYKEIATMLVEAGANLDERMEIKELSFLHFLAAKNCPEDNDFALLLMDHGADVNAVNEDGLSVLDWAIFSGKTLMIQELLRRGAEITHTTLSTVVGCEKAEELIPLLIDDADLETRNRRAIYAFSHLILQENTNLKIVRMMLNLGIPLNQRTEFGYTVLQAAVWKENVDMVKLLLDHGADINTTTQNGFYPLTIASSLQQTTITKLLIERGANIHDPSTISGSYPIHIACSTLSTKNVKLLLNLGADITVTNKHGRTPFSLMKSEENPLDESVVIVIKHIALLVFQAAKVHQDDLAIIDDTPMLQSIFEMCLSELERMKEIIVYGDISLFCIIGYNVEKLSMLVRNNDFVDNYRRSCWTRKARFPLYFGEMETKFAIAETRRDIVSSEEEFLDVTFGDSLPFVVLKNIAHYLCLDEIREVEKNYYLSLE